MSMLYFVGRSATRWWALTALAAIGVAALGTTARADEKPPLAPDTVAPFTTDSRVSAAIEYGLSSLASRIEEDIPRRLSTIDEQVSCVHRRGMVFRVNANCDIYGYVERSGPVSLYGRGERLYGSVPIHGVLEGQAPTALPRVSTARLRPAQRSRSRRTRNSARTGRST
jgi:hypothetical protein